ncbi:endolysin [Mycobacterium phage BTCU-1]|uniref:Lysin A n=1 Tax=Mycobacterium phage BTCU-1 TaxID=1262532 RepID=R9R591_9CAUD|nr:endolysin [Mycobacterium phage BTCU-1]AGI61688.1 lysin A [Mycobacterium phage BTCU-1]
MTERVLPYDRNIVPQETGWWCGPAATQVVLNSRGIIVPEATLANEIEQIENPGRGDDRDGTDYVGLIEQVLDRRVPEAKYTSVYMPNDPPTAAQREALWQNIVRSINAGWGVIMNWVAPPSNKPRGVKGSPNPKYSGGTTYHYVACMGYDDTPGARALWIADSGFQPFNYWISFDQAATLIPPKGYAYAATTATAPAPAPAPVDAAPILARAAGISEAKAREILPTFRDGLRLAECNNVPRIAMFIAQTGHESDNFNATQEYDHGRNYGDPNEATDRWKYKGRTWIQITWRGNYERFSRWCFDRKLVPTPTYFVDNPRALADVRWAGIGAAWYWTVERPSINRLCDERNLTEVTRLINGGTSWEAPTWMKHRKERYDRALAVGNDLLKLLDGEEEGFLSALTPKEQRELYDEIMKRGPSRSFLADDGRQIETLLGFIYNIDGNAWNIVNILGCLIGVPECVDDIRDVAENGVRKGSYAESNPWLAQFGQEFCKRLLPLAGKLSELLNAQEFKVTHNRIIEQ